MASLKRREDEDFEAYKHRRKVQAIIDRVKRFPRLIWNSKDRGAFLWGRDQMNNSLHEAHKRERILRKQAKKAARKESEND